MQYVLDVIDAVMVIDHLHGAVLCGGAVIACRLSSDEARMVMMMVMVVVAVSSMRCSGAITIC